MTYMPVKLHPGFIAYHRKKNTVKDGPRVGASPAGRVRKTVVHAPKNPKAIYAMPVVAIIGAVASAVTGFGIATAAGATMAAMVVGGAMMVGAALSVVGVVTKNEKLMKIGTVLSLAGGVGAVGLNLAGGLTNAAATVGAETAASAVPPMAEMAGGAATDAVAQTGGGILDSAARTASATGSGILNAPTAPATSALTETAASSAPIAETAANPFAPITDKLKVGQIDMSAFDKTAFNANNTAGGGILDWMNKNKQATELISGAVKGAAGAVPTDKDKALLEQAKANTALTNEQAEQLRRRAAYAQGKLYVKGG